MSCKNDASNLNSVESVVNDTIHTNVISPKEIVQDTLQPSDSIQQQSKEFELTEVKTEMKEKYGIQWEFCNCIKAMDSIEQALSNNSLTDKQLDFLLQRSAFIDNKCKELTNSTHNTKDEREAYQKKVNDCLKK